MHILIYVQIRAYIQARVSTRVGVRVCVSVCVLTHRLLLQPGECFNSSECVGVFFFLNWV